MKAREFQYIGGKSRKFWSIMPVSTLGTNGLVMVHFGRIGTEGQTRTTVHSSKALAANDYAKRIQSKLDKGYVEVGSVANVEFTPPKKNTIEWKTKQDPLIEKKVRRFLNLGWRGLPALGKTT